MKLQNKIALVTGASRGIGKAIASLFSQQGATVVINYHQNQSAAQQVVEEITKFGGKAIAIQADVSNESDIKRLFSEIITQYQTLDILVNNAGIMHPQGPLDMDWQTVNQTFLVDIIGPMFCAKEASKIFLNQQKAGTIINIASARGLNHLGIAGNLAYSAAKAAVINFSCTLAKDWDLKKYKIRVNAIAPGYTNTDMASWDEVTIQRKAQETVLNKILDPIDIANAALFLASDDASGITGELLTVDAGLHLK